MLHIISGLLGGTQQFEGVGLLHIGEPGSQSMRDKGPVHGFHIRVIRVIELAYHVRWHPEDSSYILNAKSPSFEPLGFVITDGLRIPFHPLFQNHQLVELVRSGVIAAETISDIPR